MPAFKQPPESSNVTLDPPPASSQLLLFRPHIYLALAVLAGVVVVRFAARRLSIPSYLGYGRPAQFRSRQTGSSKDPGSCERDFAAAPATRATAISGAPSPFKSLGFEKEPQTLWAAGLLRPTAPLVRMDFDAAAPGMGALSKDRAGSRGVSNSSASDLTQQHPSLPAYGPRLERGSSRSPQSPRSPSSSRRYSTNSDGTSDGKGSAMTDDGRPGVHRAAAAGPAGELEQHFGGDSSTLAGEAAGTGRDLDYATPRQFSRPPPPLPLTPPALSAAMFTFEDRRPGYAVSIPPQLDATFIHQPNPDYLASSTAAEVSSSPQNVATTPRRRSYAKTMPIGIPVPSGSTSSPRSQDSSASSDVFSPSSYPPTSPRLPPPPPSHFDEPRYDHDGQQQEIDVQGEIISVVDDAGHGWKRHTRVYGGGVCLACLASGGQGGFYGDRVPLEDRR